MKKVNDFKEAFISSMLVSFGEDINNLGFAKIDERCMIDDSSIAACLEKDNNDYRIVIKSFRQDGSIDNHEVEVFEDITMDILHEVSESLDYMEKALSIVM